MHAIITSVIYYNKGDYMFNHYLTCLKKYADFSGRATRSEYWYFMLVNFLVGLVLVLLDLGLIWNLYQLFVLLPGLSVFWRRMHDIGRSGKNYFWFFLPMIGWIILLVYLTTPTKQGENKYAQ